MINWECQALLIHRRFLTKSSFQRVPACNMQFYKYVWIYEKVVKEILLMQSRLLKGMFLKCQLLWAEPITRPHSD